MDAILHCRMVDCSSWVDPVRTHQSDSPGTKRGGRANIKPTRSRLVKSSKRHRMADHNRFGRPTSVLTVTIAIGACSLVISAWALDPAQEGSAVAYSANDVGMQFVSVPAGQFPMGCSEGVKPVECAPDEKPRHSV